MPCSVKLCKFSCTIDRLYICWFIAGASKIGEAVARQIVESKSLPIPIRNRAIKSAVAGAITTKSAHFANSICPIANSAWGSSKEVETALPEIACSVSGVTKASAAGVIATRTSALAVFSKRISSIVLYAAMPPVMPIRIFLSVNIINAL